MLSRDSKEKAPKGAKLINNLGDFYPIFTGSPFQTSPFSYQPPLFWLIDTLGKAFNRSCGVTKPTAISNI